MMFLIGKLFKIIVDNIRKYSSRETCYYIFLKLIKIIVDKCGRCDIL